jgi:arginine utilization regulatory protein
MSLPLQAKLLRVLQEGYIRRIGGTKDIAVDVRIIATTNEDPKESINKGNLRRDLFYRLSVVNIHIPPLRERIEDIELLCQYFINKYNKLLNKRIERLSDLVIREFLEYSWPGNIRELENFIESAMNMVTLGDRILNKEDFISSSYIPVNLSINPKIVNMLKDSSLPDILENIERNIVKEILKKYNNNISNTAKYLGIKRQTLQHKLKRFDEVQ